MTTAITSIIISWIVAALVINAFVVTVDGKVAQGSTPSIASTASVASTASPTPPPQVLTHIHALPTSSTLSEVNKIVIRRRRLSPDNKAKMTSVMKLVELQGLKDCVGRVICDLSCNPEGYGAQGKAVFRNLLSIQSSGAVQDSELKFYVTAGVTGRKFKVEKQCSGCTTSYLNCNVTTSQLVDVANLIKLD